MLACGAYLCGVHREHVGCTAHTQGTLTWALRCSRVGQAGTWADVPPHEKVAALRVAKRQCSVLGVRSANKDEKFPPNVLIHSACRYPHGN